MPEDMLELTTSTASFAVTFTEPGDPYSIIALTPCCGASGKGMDYGTGVGCRRCKQEVDPIYGDVGCWPNYRTKINGYWLGSTPESLVRAELERTSSTNIENEALHIFERIAAAAAWRRGRYAEAHS